jgi:acyl-coenzyme A thioesterase PaaI-like protein
MSELPNGYVATRWGRIALPWEFVESAVEEPGERLGENGSSVSGHGSAVAELGWCIRSAGEDLVCEGTVLPELCVPGTDLVRTSVLATWADVVTGLDSSRGMHPQIPITVDLDLNVVALPRAGASVIGTSTLVKLGRTMSAYSVEMRVADEPAPFAYALASFMASPKPGHVAPEGGFVRREAIRHHLSVPILDRVRGRRLGRGEATVPWHVDNSNATGAIQGGLIALSIEEAALSLFDTSYTVSAISLRYFRAVRHSAVVATATSLGPDLIRVSAVDGGTGKLSTIATVSVVPTT